MSALGFVEPETVQEASDLLVADPWGAKVISGGTAVVLMMKQGLIAPELLVSLARIPDLDVITQSGPTLSIGAAATLAQVSTSPLVQALAPSLAAACGVVGNPRIRNVATLGGNVAEADYASDPPATLASLGARCRIEGSSGTRDVPVVDVITGFYETLLENGEIITRIDVPIHEGSRGAVYLKYRSRSSEDRACVGVAARVDVVDGAVIDVDVVVAAVASTLQRVPSALLPAVGTDLDGGVIAGIARAYTEGVEAMDDARGSAWYRGRMIEVFVRRALEDAHAQALKGALQHG